MHHIEIKTKEKALALIEKGVKLFQHQLKVGRMTVEVDADGVLKTLKEKHMILTRESIMNKDGHNFTKSWAFESEEEKDLANAFAAYIELNGGSSNDAYQLFGAVCRVGKGSGGWT